VVSVLHACGSSCACADGSSRCAAAAQVRLRVSGIRFPPRPISTDVLRCAARHAISLAISLFVAAHARHPLTPMLASPAACRGPATCCRSMAACPARRLRLWSWWCVPFPFALVLRSLACSCARCTPLVR
jgi:hypothetical protein